MRNGTIYLVSMSFVFFINERLNEDFLLFRQHFRETKNTFLRFVRKNKINGIKFCEINNATQTMDTDTASYVNFYPGKLWKCHQENHLFWYKHVQNVITYIIN